MGHSEPSGQYGAAMLMKMENPNIEQPYSMGPPQMVLSQGLSIFKQYNLTLKCVCRL